MIGHCEEEEETDLAPSLGRILMLWWLVYRKTILSAYGKCQGLLVTELAKGPPNSAYFVEVVDFELSKTHFI